MASKKMKQVFGTANLTPEQKANVAAARKAATAVRAEVEREFPPAKPRLKPAIDGIGLAVRQAREARGLTWYALAKAAGIPNQNTVRDIEYDRDVNLSNLQAVAKALGLRLELVTA